MTAPHTHHPTMVGPFSAYACKDCGLVIRYCMNCHCWDDASLLTDTPSGCAIHLFCPTGR